MAGKFTIVSNTYGEIEKILIKTSTPGHKWMEHYEGLKKVIDKRKIVGVIQKLRRPRRTSFTEQKPAGDLSLNLKITHETLSEDEYNKFVEKYKNFQAHADRLSLEIARETVGEDEYNKLVEKYKNYLNRDNRTINEDKTKSLPQAIAQEFDTDIEQAAERYAILKFKEKFANDSIPQLIITSDLGGSYRNETDDDLWDYEEHNFYIQDSFHALQKFDNQEQIQCIYTTETHPINLKTVQKLKHKFPYIDLYPVPYKEFAGGNIIPSSNYLLVGKDTIHANADLTDFETKLSSLFDIENIIPVGMTEPIEDLYEIRSELGKFYQPIFHIDFFITPAGTTPEGKELIFIGKVDGSLYNSTYLDEQKIKVIELLNTFIDETVTNLLETGKKKNIEFIPVEIPLFAFFSDVWRDTGEKFQRINRYSTFNNAIVEITSTSKNIFMSDYDNNNANFELAKNQIRTTLCKHGFTVEFVSPPADSLFDGALHCYTKVIWRKKYSISG